MQESDTATESEVLADSSALWHLSVVGGVLLGIFLAVSRLAGPFRYQSGLDRPILIVTGLLVLATFISLVGIRLGQRVSRPNETRLLWLIVLFAASFRAVFVFTPPILEIDYYRYIWDGRVVNAGVSPYRFSPKQVLDAKPWQHAGYQKVAALASKTASNQTVLSRIHYEQYTTIYPPVSQFVFASAMRVWPDDSSVEAHVVWMKTVLVLFDFLTIGILVLTLKRVGRHSAWLIAYAWNPLVLKEVANGGHLDSIAVFFLTAAIYAFIPLLTSDSRRRPEFHSVIGGVCLGLGCGAKLFPVVLLPALFVVALRSGYRTAIAFLAVFSLVGVMCLAPMLWPHAATGTAIAELDLQPASSRRGEVLSEHKEGLSSFLTNWQMNDAAFSFVYRNVKPNSQRVEEGLNLPWYVLTSNRFRIAVSEFLEDQGFEKGRTSFLVARLATLAVFLAVYLFQLSRLYQGDVSQVLNSLLLLLSAFLFLQPTVNPWYWLWAMPLVCFARNPGWQCVAPFLLLYYTRFWFKSLDASFEFLGTHYQGVGLFDHGVVWLELVGIVAMLAIFRLNRCRIKKNAQSPLA